MAITERDVSSAEARMQTIRQTGYAIDAHYDRTTSRIVVRLASGLDFSFPIDLAEGLSNGSPDDLAEIEISPAGLGLHWPKLDADLYIPSLLQGVFGSKSWMARQLGTSGGKSRSAAKTTSARENGRKGGRPRKSATG